MDRASDSSMLECIDACSECHSVCTEMVTHCLQRGGKHADTTHIRLLLDCADICRISMDFMLRRSDVHHLTCGVCAEVCRRCAASCEQMADDDQMRWCAEVCRLCAQSCDTMSKGR